MENPAIRIQMRAPFTAGKKIGRASRTSAAVTQTYAYRWSTRWSRSRTTTTMNSATPSVDQTSWIGAARSPGCLQVEPVDQDQAEAVEQHADGQQQRVGVGGAQAHRDMREEREHAEPGAVTGGAGRDGAVLGEADVAVAVHAQQDGDDDEGELDATAPGDSRGGSGGIGGLRQPRLRGFLGLRRHGGSGLRHVRNLPKAGGILCAGQQTSVVPRRCCRCSGRRPRPRCRP